MTNEENWDDAQEVQSNWFKFANVGDRIKGTLVGKRLQPGDGDFGDQMVYKVRKEDGTEWNVGIAMTKTGTVERLNNCKLGEIVGVSFDSEGEPPKKGFHPVKNLKVFTFGMDPDYNEFDGADEVPAAKEDDLPPV